MAAGYFIYRPPPGTRGPSDQHLTAENEAKATRPHLIQWRTDGTAAPRATDIAATICQLHVLLLQLGLRNDLALLPSQPRPPARPARLHRAVFIARSQRPVAPSVVILCYCSSSNHHEEEIQ